MTATQEIRQETVAGRWVNQGIAGGIVAGIVFAFFQMVVAVLMMGPGAFFLPLRMIGAMVLGQQALDPSYDQVLATLTGLIVHLVLSAGFGAGFGKLGASIATLPHPAAVLPAAASVYGLLLWLVNFYVIAPAAGWHWFPDDTHAVVQFLAHTFSFGTTLGFYLREAFFPRPVAAVPAL
jgi:hypothetical protein